MEKVLVRGDGFVFGEKRSQAQGMWRRGVDMTEPPTDTGWRERDPNKWGHFPCSERSFIWEFM